MPAGLTDATAISAGESVYLALAGVQQPKVAISFIAPLNQNVQVGSQAFFSVSAVGTPPLRYQWYFGTNAISGATNRWLALSNVTNAQAGSYSVLVSNSDGSAMSNPVTLTVIPAIELNMVPAILLKGGAGVTFRIDYINAVGPANSWVPLATITLTNNQQFYFDVSAIGQPTRFYRLVQLP